MGIFHTVLYQPLLNLLIGLYDVIPYKDIGFAIIALTIIIKLLLWPLSQASLKSQKALQEIQPKLDALKAKHQDNKDALAKEMMLLYKEEKVNPLSSCLPVLVQLPILFALYAVLRAGIDISSFSDLYGFVPVPESINTVFLGIINLNEKSIPLAVLAGIFQFFQTKMLMSRRPPRNLRKKDGAKDEDMMASMNKSMVYFMPVITIVIGTTLPGGLTLYWVAVNIFSIVQQSIIFHGIKQKKINKAEDVVHEGEVIETKTEE